MSRCFLSPNKSKQSTLGVVQVRRSHETADLAHGTHNPWPWKGVRQDEGQLFSHSALYRLQELSGPLAQEPLRAVSAGVNKEGPVLPRGCLCAANSMSLLVRLYN